MRFRRRVNRLCLGLGAMSALGSSAAAQVVNPAVLIATPLGTGAPNQEVAIASSPASPDEVIVAFQTSSGEGQGAVHCSVSLNGGLTYSAPVKPFPLCLGSELCCTAERFDPGLVCSPTVGDAWVSCVDGASLFAEGRVLVARRPVGTTLFQSYVQTTPCTSADKAFFAVGPWPQGTGTHSTEAMYGGYSQWPQGFMYSASAADVLPTGSIWPGTPTLVTSGARTRWCESAATRPATPTSGRPQSSSTMRGA